MKTTQIQRSAQRAPQQERARQKVELILEAAMRLLDKGGLAALTTNAVAQTAGVSIGTLYQYFPHKEAILDALAEIEMAALSQRILAALGDAAARSPQDRIGRIIRAVTASYGKRRRIHRVVIEYSLSRGGTRMDRLIERIVALLAAPDRRSAAPALPEAQAFVLAHAFAGVMRAMILRPDPTVPPQAELEKALARLMTAF